MKKITLLLFSALCIAGNAQIPTNGLKAHYQFTNDVNDNSVNGNTGIAIGCDYVNDRFGNPTSAIHLDGVDDLLELPIAGFGPITGDFTISFWLKSSEQLPTQFLSYGDVAGSASFMYFLNTSAIGMMPYWASGANIPIEKNSMIANDVWHNVILSSENGIVKVWLDKMLRNTETINDDIGDSFDSFFIGAISYATSLYKKYNGSVDDLAFYDRALTLNEIDDVYHDQNKIVVASPKKTDAYVFNDTCVIQWKNTYSITNILAEYSIDNGNNWSFITNLNPSTQTSYSWGLTFPIGTNVLVKLSNADDLSVFDISKLTISEYNWELVNQTCDFSQRDGQDLISFNNKLWHVAGWGAEFAPPAITTNEIWSSTDGENWEFVIEAPWNGRHAVSFVKFQNKVWVLNGDGNAGFLNKDIWNTSDMIHWTKISDSLKTPERILEMSAILNGKMYIFGGQQINDLWVNSIDTFYNDVYSSTDGVTWNQETSNAPWSPRGIIHGQCVDNADTLWLLGGGRYQSFAFNDIWNTVDGITWNKVLDCAPFPARVYYNVEYFDNKMWVMAGNQGYDYDDIISEDFLGDRRDVWYSSNGRDWFELKNTPWPNRHGAGTDILNNNLYITGGYENDLWKLVKQ